MRQEQEERDQREDRIQVGRSEVLGLALGLDLFGEQTSKSEGHVRRHGAAEGRHVDVRQNVLPRHNLRPDRRPPDAQNDRYEPDVDLERVARAVDQDPKDDREHRFQSFNNVRKRHRARGHGHDGADVAHRV